MINSIRALNAAQARSLDPYHQPHAGLDIVYADDDLVVLRKPHGLLCVPGKGPQGRDCLSARVQAVLPQALVVHRLDMATAGLVVMANSVLMQRALSMAFAARQVEKTYIAEVHGLVPPPSSTWGLIDLPLICDWPQRPRQKVCFESGKSAQTHYRVLSHDLVARTTRVALQPLTGRSHQLRVHMLSLGYPIIGDMLYANPTTPPSPSSVRLHLHASELSLQHPRHRAGMHWRSSPDF